MIESKTYMHLKFSDQIQYKGNNDAKDYTGREWEVKCKVFLFDNNVTWKPSQKWQLIRKVYC